MDRGDDPAFPSHRGGTQPEPGVSIREYISIEILAALIGSHKDYEIELSMSWMVEKSLLAADLWLAERAKRTAPKAQ